MTIFRMNVQGTKLIPHGLKAILLGVLLSLTACNGGTGNTRPTEIVVVTSESAVDTISHLQSTITALQTQSARTPTAGVTLLATISPTVIGQGRVIGQNAVLLANAEASATQIGLIPQGLIVDIVRRSEPDRLGLVFYQVEFQNQLGWVASPQLELVAEGLPTESTANDETVSPSPNAMNADQMASPAPSITASPSGTTPPTATHSPSTTPFPTATPSISPTPYPEGFPTPSLYSVVIVEQIFERGRMIWFEPLREVWVMVGDEVDPTEGAWECYLDTFVEGQPERDPRLDPEPNTVISSNLEGTRPTQPIRGFGKIWRENFTVREALGWAITPETLHTTRYEYQPGGEMRNGRYVAAPGTYRLDSVLQHTLVFTEDIVGADCARKAGLWLID